MSNEPLALDALENMSTANLRKELTKRNIDCTDSSRLVLLKQLREVLENSDYSLKCYSGTKCETGVLYWDIGWDAIECISAIGPGQSIKSTNIRVGDYDWYAELFPKGELQKNNNNINILNDNDVPSHASPSSITAAPALFLSICKTIKRVQMRFTVQLYSATSSRWSSPVISSLRVFERNNHGWGWKEWMDYNDLKRDYEYNHKLKLKISIDVYGPVVTQIINDKISFNLQSELSKKMAHLFKNSTHCDAIIVVCGYTMYPNKCKLLQNNNNNNNNKNNSNSLDDNINSRKRKLSNYNAEDDDSNMPAHKRRKLNCIDIGNNNNISSSYVIKNNNNNNIGEEIEKLSVLGIDEEKRDKNGTKFVSLEIPVHRCILANFSPYFASMFAHKFRENVDGKIYIGKQLQEEESSSSSEELEGDFEYNDFDNVDPYVMKVLLEYIYCESIDLSVDRYLLLLLADRYQIERLVMLCLQDLTNEMNINNVTTILSISNKFNEKYSCANKVKLICLDFICKNISFVMETSSYKNCIKNDKNITQEILTAFANNHKKSIHS